MKMRFQAVDKSGSIIRHTMRAENEEEAREILFEEGLVPKNLEPAGEEEKVDWAPRTRIERIHRERALQAGRDSELKTEGLPRTNTTLHVGDQSWIGTIGVRQDRSIVFESKSDPTASRLVRMDDVEIAKVVGFPLRMLRVVLLNGEMLEFTAGFLSAHPVFHTARAALSGQNPKTR